MEYSIVLFGKDVSKLAYKSNCESLALTDCCGNVRQYFQVVALMLKDKIRCVIREKNDYDFGECYSVGKRDGKEVLIIENDENILEEVYIYYFAHCKCLVDNMPSHSNGEDLDR